MTLNVVTAAHLADAFEHVGRVNHYMVGVIGTYTDEELDRAEQILINKQNMGPQRGPRYCTLERALNEIDIARTKRNAAAFCTMRGHKTLSPERTVISPTILAALKAARQVFDEALPKFNWGSSALDANALHLLNTVRGLVEAAIIEAEKS